MMEKIDDLQRCGYKLIQDDDYFCFGMDAVLLSVFITQSKVFNIHDPDQNFLDMCCGNGIIPILTAAKTSVKHIYGIEIQEIIAALAKRSVAYNRLEERITIITGDILNSSHIFGKQKFNAISVNPPYIKSGSGIINPNSPKAIARHEIKCGLGDVCGQAACLLLDKAPLFMVHKPHRLVDVISAMRYHNLEPKRLRFVHSFADSEPTMFLIEAVKGGGRELMVEKPLVLFKETNVYTDEVEAIYKF